MRFATSLTNALVVCCVLASCSSVNEPARDLARVTLAEVVRYQEDSATAARVLESYTERREAAIRSELAVALRTEARAAASAITRDAAEVAARRSSFRASDLSDYLRERSELDDAARRSLAEALAAYEGSAAELRISTGRHDKKLNALRQKLEALQGERTELDRVVFVGDALLAVLRGPATPRNEGGATP